MTWKDCFEDFYNMNAVEKDVVQCVVSVMLEIINYFGGEKIRRNELEMSIKGQKWKR